MIKARTSDMVIDKSLYLVSCQVSSTRHSSRGSTNSLHRSLTWSTAKSVVHGIVPEDLQIASPNLTWSNAKTVVHGIVPEDLQIAFTESYLVKCQDSSKRHCSRGSTNSFHRSLSLDRRFLSSFPRDNKIANKIIS